MHLWGQAQGFKIVSRAVNSLHVANAIISQSRLVPWSIHEASDPSAKVAQSCLLCFSFPASASGRPTVLATAGALAAFPSPVATSSEERSVIQINKSMMFPSCFHFHAREMLAGTGDWLPVFEPVCHYTICLSSRCLFCLFFKILLFC